MKQPFSENNFIGKTSSLPPSSPNSDNASGQITTNNNHRQDSYFASKNFINSENLANSPIKISKRYLPHWELNGSIYFITFKTWKRLELTPEARKVVLDACLYFHNKRYKIYTIVVMPDHVHFLLEPSLKSENEYWSLSSILHSIKSYSAKQIPKVMKHTGIVWQDESYDRIVRDDQEFTQFWSYIRENPVKANLSNSPEEYAFFWEIDCES
jgi:REP element-mobilizing transposase RayT